MYMRRIILITFAVLLFHNLASAQWVQQPEPVSTPMYNIDFVNRWTGWATGSNSVILKTTDGGASWFDQSIDLGYPKNLYGLDMLDANTGYIAGWFETILKTTNGGTNWNIISNIPSNNGNSNEGMFFFNAQTGWICSSLGRVLRTTNGGIFWDSSYAANIMFDIQFVNSQTGWVCGVGGTLFKSTDGGINWESGPLLTGANLSAVYFVDVNTGWLVSEQGRRIFRTTNAGTKWDTVSVLPGLSTDFLYSVHFVNSQTGWTGGSNSQLYKTVNGGLNWLKQTVPTTLYVYNFSFFNDSIGWATGGNQGVIIHTTNGGTYVGVEPNANSAPVDFVLHQNYPNPFNPITRIKFDLPKLSFVKLTVFDVLGRETEVLVNSALKTGTYSIEWNASELPSGVYFYKLTTENVFLTKKMLLLK